MSPVVVGNGAIILLHRDEETDLRIFFCTQIFLIKVVGYLFPKAQLSSPRAKRAGPKGLRAESARAVTGRRCPHSGMG